MTQRWNVELHSHTHWSKDCIVSFEAIRRACQRRGVDKIAITDHNTADSALAFHAVAPNLVIVGEEIMTTQGELLAYFVRETVPAGLTPEETIRRLRDQGAAISVSHPFDRLRKGAWRETDLMRIIDKVDAIETFNARCMFPQDNEKAVTFAQAHGLRGTAGSDAHTVGEYGQSGMMMDPFADATSFLESLASAQAITRLSGWQVHWYTRVAKWTKKLGLVPTPSVS